MKRMSKLTGYDWLKLCLYTIALALITWGFIYSRGHLFLGFAWLAVAFVAPDAHDEEEDVL
ncbi:MAG: hypothetical protein K1V99_09650 [Bacteroidales bacterium]